MALKLSVIRFLRDFLFRTLNKVFGIYVRNLFSYYSALFQLYSLFFELVVVLFVNSTIRFSLLDQNIFPLKLKYSSSITLKPVIGSGTGVFYFN